MKKNLVETSLGRIMFNTALPENYPFQNYQIKVKDLETISRNIIESYDPSVVEVTLDKIKELGFEYSTWAGISWGMDDLIVPPEKEKIVADAEKEIEEIETHFKKGLLSREEKTNKAIEIWSRVKTKIEEL